MKTFKRSISFALICILLISSVAVGAWAAEVPAVTAQLQGNTAVVFTADEKIKAVSVDETLASVSIDGNTATVTALTEDAALLDVTVKTASASAKFEVPLGYTTFCFAGDTLTVYEGSDTKYEIAGINMADEEYVEGDETYPLPVEYDEAGNAVYKNTDTYTINVGIKKKGGSLDTADMLLVKQIILNG